MHLNETQYEELSEFIESLSKRDSIKLSSKFKIPHDIQDEIFECLDTYYEPKTTLTAPPRERASEPAGGGRSFIEVFHMNDGSIGAECILFANGKPDEAILHIEMASDSKNPALTYKYIGS